MKSLHLNICGNYDLSLFVLQALDSLQRAQELADGMGNKVAEFS